MAEDELPQEGYVVTFVGDPSADGQFFRITAREPFTYRTGDTSGPPEFSTVASGGSTGFKDITVLEPDQRPQHAAYVQIGLKDGLKYQLKLKSGTIRLGPDQDKNAGYLFKRSSPYFEEEPDMAMWLLGPDWYPSIQATNPTPWTATPKVYFRGFKFEMEALDAVQAEQAKAAGRYTIITLGGVTS